MKCQYHGCKKEAVFQTKLLIGKKQTLLMCDTCAPQWVKEFKAPAWYAVRKVDGEWVRGSKENNPPWHNPK